MVTDTGFSDVGVDVATVRERFERRYEQLYGHMQPEGRLEVTGVGVVAEGALDAAPPTRVPEIGDELEPEHRRCWLGPVHGWEAVPVYAATALGSGRTLTGPYLIEAATTTVLGLPEDRLTVRSTGDLEVELP